MNATSRSLPPTAEATIHAFLRARVSVEGIDGVVVGLSGGIDSALVARLARDALGAARVLGVLLPDAAYPPPLREETEAYADALGIEHRTIAIDRVESAYRSLLPEIPDRVTWGNTKARIRMTVLYAIARERRRLVLGTGNKSELLLGYFTKHGDGGADLLPIGDLYKTQVQELAARLDLPRAVRERAPSAGLWEGQTDEAELGLGYRDLDRILAGIEDRRDANAIAASAGLPLETVDGIVQRVEVNRHKLEPTSIPKIGTRTIGIDWHDSPSHGRASRVPKA